VSKLLVVGLASIASDPDAEQIREPDPYLDCYLPLREVPDEMPPRRRGSKLALATLYRWSGPRGCKGIILRTVQIGCSRVTTRRWLLVFFEALAAKTRDETVVAPSGQTASLTSRMAAAQRRAEADDQKLEELGVGL
jgi:hypothetical protein